MLTFKSALFFALIGIVFMIKNPFHKRGFLRAQGIITDYERDEKDGEDVFFAKVKFPLGEREILFTDKTPRRKKPRFGKIVEVLYNEENPKEACIEGAFSIIFPWIFILISFFILIYNLKQTFIF